MKKFKTITEYELLGAAFNCLLNRQCDDKRLISTFGANETLIAKINERKKQMDEIKSRMAEIEEKENAK